MSQSPLSNQSPNIYPQGPQKPTMLTVMAILGIVFGSIGVLCIGGGELINLFAFMNPAMSRITAAQPFAQKIVNLILGLFSIGFCGVLLWGSIAAINLKPAARRLMVGWAVADIMFDFARLVIGLVMLSLMPPLAQNPAFQQNPAFANNPNVMAYAKVMGVVGALLWWAVGTTFAVLIFVCYRKPDVVAAFEQPPQNPNVGLPPPPM